MHYILEKEKIGSLAREIFGPDRVWIQSVTEDVEEQDEESEDYECMVRKEVIHIYIHFPSITITNSHKSTHTIEDLYIRLSLHDLNIDREEKFYYQFYGMRTTVSLKEVDSSYSHSHLPGGCYAGQWGEFCLGASIFGVHLTHLRSCPTEEGWYLLFLALPAYLGWESLEGGPHRQIENIQSRIRPLSSSRIIEEARKLLPGLPPEVWEFSPAGRLTLLEHHPLLFPYFNAHSALKRINGIGPLEEKKRAQEMERRWSSFLWKGGEPDEKRVPFRVKTPEETACFQGSIEPALVALYIAEIKKLAEHYSNFIVYEQHKQLYQNIVFPAGLEQAGAYQ